jgi:hypothetical protein
MTKIEIIEDNLLISCVDKKQLVFSLRFDFYKNPFRLTWPKMAMSEDGIYFAWWRFSSFAILTGASSRKQKINVEKYLLNSVKQVKNDK